MIARQIHTMARGWRRGLLAVALGVSCGVGGLPPELRGESFTVVVSGSWGSAATWAGNKTPPVDGQEAVNVAVSEALRPRILDLAGSTVRIGTISVDRRGLSLEVTDSQSDLNTARLLIEQIAVGAGGTFTGADSVRMAIGTLGVNERGESGKVFLKGVIQSRTDVPGRVIVGGGEVHFSGDHEYDGGTELRGGVVAVVRSNQAFGDVIGDVKLHPGVVLRGDTEPRRISNAISMLGGGTVELGAVGTDLLTLEGPVVLAAGGSQQLRVLSPVEISGGILDGGSAGQSSRLIKTGGAKLVLSGANSFTGGLELREGTVEALMADALGGGGSAAGVTVKGGTLALYADQTVGGLSIHGGSIVTDSIFPAAVVVAGSGGILVDNAGRATVNAPLSEDGGAVKLVKKGSGTVSLNAPNSYSGGTEIHAGTVLLGDDAALGSGPVTLRGGAIEAERIKREIANALEILGTVQMKSTVGGSLLLSGPIALSGAGNPVVISGSVGWGGVVSDGGMGVAVLKKSGPGTLGLYGANTYSGGSVLEAGGVVFSSGGLGTTGPIRFAGGSLSYAAGNSDDISGRVTGSTGAIRVDTQTNTVTWVQPLAASNTGGLTKSGSGILVLNARNAYSGPTEFQAGTVTFSASGLGTGGAIRFAGGSLRYAVGNADDVSARIQESTGAIFVDTNSNKVEWRAPLARTNSAGLTKLGSGELVLVSENKYAGRTELRAGTLGFVSGALSDGPVVFRGGQLRYESGNTEDISGRVRQSTQPIRIDTGGNEVEWATAVEESNTGGLVKLGAGTLRLNAVNRFSGGVEFSGGIVVFGTGGLGNGNLVFSGGTLQYGGKNGEDVSGRILGSTAPISVSVTDNRVAWNANIRASNTAGFWKMGDGELALSGSNQYGGDTILGKGIVEFGRGSLSAGSITFRGGSLRYSLGNTEDISARISNSSSRVEVDTNGNDVTWSTALNSSNVAGFSKLGSGSLTVLPQSLAQGATVSGGYLVLDGLAATTSQSSTNVFFSPVSAPTAATASLPTVQLRGSSTLLGRGSVTLRGNVEVRGTAVILGGNDSLTVQGRISIPTNSTLKVGGKVKTETFEWAGTLVPSGSHPLEVAGAITVAKGAVLSLNQPRLTPVIQAAPGTLVDLSGLSLRITPEMAQQALVSGSGIPLSLLVSGGTITAVPQNPARVSAVLSVRAEGARFVVQRKPYTEFLPNSSKNGFGKTFTAWVGSGSGSAQLRAAFDEIDRLDSAEAVVARLRDLDGGARYAATSELLIRQTQLLSVALDSYLESVATEVAGWETPLKLGVHIQAPVHPSPAPAPAPPGQSSGEKAWAVWASTFGGRVSMDADAARGDPSGNADAQGGVFGLERKVGQIRFGITGALSEGVLSTDGTPFRIETQSASIGGYSIVRIDRVVMDTSVLWARSDNRSERAVTGATAYADYASNSFSTTLGGLVHLAPENSNWVLTPMARARFLLNAQQSFDEQGVALGIHSDPLQSTRWVSKLGVRFGRRSRIGKQVELGVFGSTHWVHEYYEGDTSAFRLGGVAYRVRAREMDPDSIQLQLSAYANFEDSFVLRFSGQQDRGAQGCITSGALSVSFPF